MAHRMAIIRRLVVLGLLIVVGSAIFRAVFVFKSRPPPKPCLESGSHHNITLAKDPAILKRFIDILNIPSISYEPHLYDADQMLKIIQYIEKNYPTLNNSPLVERMLIANYSLLYFIKGSNEKLRPYMLTSHLDVVPVVRKKWSSEPFQAAVKSDGYIYARGTMDAKHLTVAILEAIEFLLKGNFQPKRSIYLAFGHDEEVLGEEGAQRIATIVKDRIKAFDKLEYIIDEGNIISKSRFPGVPYDIALIGVSEKGYLSLNVSTVGEVGHGSMPHPKTAISKLAQVLSRFHSSVVPSMIGQGVEREMFDILAAYAEWPQKLVYANFWLFKPVIDHIFSQHPALNGLIRSTTAVTMIRGGVKENMLPDSASAIINQRIHEKQTVSEIIDLDRKIIDDPTVNLRVQFSCEPKPISPYCDDCNAYQLIKHSVLQVYPNTIAVPSVFLATTDSKWYQHLTDSIYRFSAVAVELAEMKNFHGHDERLSVENYEKLINFYHHLVLNSDDPKLNFGPETRDEL